MEEKDQASGGGAAAFPDEIAHLADINEMLDEALTDAASHVERIDKEYRDMKRYMADARGEIDPHEMFQNHLSLRQIDGTGAFAVTVRDKIAKLKDSPYFARIDFREDHAGGPDAVYIGRFAFSHGDEQLISDWRSPIAGMFYDCEAGPAGYLAPGGQIKGEITRKRQFKIRNGRMEYALESSANIQDDVLQQELSRTADEKMKSIISTIQKEQNRIIRNETAGTLLLQGVAGSGKTSIALHRIAFLLYRQKDRLSAKNVTILSPNRVFGDYISNVLPELGEEPIYEVSLADIAEVQLEGVLGFEADREPLEAAEWGDDGWAERARFKSTLAFVGSMDGFIARLPEIAFEAADYGSGRFAAKAEDITARFRAYDKHPIQRRLQLVADDIYDRFDTDNIMEEEIPKSRTILKALKGMLKSKSALALYQRFYREIGRPDMLAMPGPRTLEWSDVYPFLYLRAAFEGLRESEVIRHLVVDEMQDYTPIQFAVINRLFPCRKTILGDFNQRVNPNHLHTLEDLRQLYDGADFVELVKSYRSTYEIISFAKGIKSDQAIDAIERHGEAPGMIRCRDSRHERQVIGEKIEKFRQSGGGSLGVITKTDGEARELFGELSRHNQVHLLSPESTRFENGVTVASIRMSKGLEFDEVIIPSADNRTYHTEHDRSLLYVACTRAMHRLTLLYSGEKSPILP